MYLLLQEVTKSESFQLYAYYSQEFSRNKLGNRLALFFEKRGKPSRMSLPVYLILCYKLVNEEFLSGESEKNNQSYYERVIQNCLPADSVASPLDTLVLQEYL